MNILRLPGPNALSDFRRDVLLLRCRQAEPAVRGLEARHFYLVHWQDGDRNRLEALVFGDAAGPDGPPTEGPGDPGDTTIRIAPRPGTISPWSTKATDILRNCGLTSVARIERGTEYRILSDGPFSPASLLPLLHDRMTEAVLHDDAALFSEVPPRPLQRVSLAEGPAALERANGEMGLALSDDEIRYLFDAFAALRRDPTDVELVMFANVNSEHCRHKIFNADWTIDGPRRERTLFAMIRNTHARCPQGTVKAYADNAGVIAGWRTPSFRPDPEGPFAYRRGGDRDRRPVPGRPLRLFHLPPAHPGIRAALGARLRRVPRAPGDAAADHDRRPPRRRRLQQRVRPPEHPRPLRDPHRFPFDHLISWGAEFSRHQGDFYGDSTRAGSGGVGGANPEFVLCLMLQVGNSAFPGEAGAAGKFGPGAPVIGPPAVDLVLPPGNAVVVGVRVVPGQNDLTISSLCLNEKRAADGRRSVQDFGVLQIHRPAFHLKYAAPCVASIGIWVLRGETEAEFEARRARLIAGSKTGTTRARRKRPESDEAFQARLAEKYAEPGMFHRERLYLSRDRFRKLQAQL